MATEQKKRRPPVFQESESASPIEIDPPFQPAEEDFSDVIGAEPEQAPEPEPKDVESGSVEEPSPLPAAEPEAASAPDELPAGWRLISEAQHDGRSYFVTSDLASEGEVAFWRKTRSLSHFRWVMHGKWSNSLTRRDVLPEPRFFRELDNGR
jgi:hypothetical protein